MTNFEFTPLVFLISTTVGYLGALTGGGIIVTPSLHASIPIPSSFGLILHETRVPV